MREFSKKEMLIFVVCLMLGAVLIGLGMAYVILFKQRIFPSGQTTQSEIRPVLCVAQPCRFDAGIAGEFQLARKMKTARTATSFRADPAQGYVLPPWMLLVPAGAAKQSNSPSAEIWIASSRSPSSGAHSRDPLAPRNDDGEGLA